VSSKDLSREFYFELAATAKPFSNSHSIKEESPMPVYEYRCTKCSEQFEVNQKITDTPLTECSSCGGELKKLITNTSFVLKGSGWYVTDYPSSERKQAVEAEKSASKETQKKTETGKEKVKT
jgi:putative FmdB family regulatory protein